METHTLKNSSIRPQRYFAATIVLAAVFAFSTTSVQAYSSEVERLGDLIAHRLQLMEGVAAYKYLNDRQVSDPAREASVLAAGKSVAYRGGLDPETVAPFVQAQMDAAKEIQSALIAQWREGGADKPASSLDLSKELRPAITAATKAVVEQLALTAPLLVSTSSKQILKRRISIGATGLPLSVQTIDKLVEGAALVKYAPAPKSLLDHILADGVLRVGATGDYAPFSLNIGANYMGIDADLAQALATSLNVELVFAPTSWPTLMDDLHADRYDIGMSGITRTLQRAKSASFSDPYHQGGKAPIVRCGEEQTFNSLDAIDRSGVRVVVNPGGTNEKFARAEIQSAELILYEDNTQIFNEIIHERADVMITDAIEVAFQSARNPLLCPAMGDMTLTQSEKGFLLPRDEAWRLYVNQWLRTIRNSGELEEIFSRHIEGE
jgi:cyclohexadienyl dehydratase